MNEIFGILYLPGFDGTIVYKSRTLPAIPIILVDIFSSLSGWYTSNEEDKLSSGS